MSGYVGDLTPLQEEALQQFKASLLDIPNKPENTDEYFLKWLRSRKFDIQKAEVMFRNHMEHRKKYGLDTILDDYTPSQMFKECLTGGFFGEDVDGHPVWYENIGNLDPKGLYRSLKSFDELVKYTCYNQERREAMVKKVSAEKGRSIEKITVLMDFKNLSFRRHYHWPSLNMFKELLAINEANNPECTRRFLFVNTPAIFPFIYNIVKHVLDETTRRKVVLFSVNCNLREEISKYISPDQLPALYGGDRYEPDAECSDYIRHGGDVDPKYYLTNCTETSKEEMERVVVGRGSSHKVRHQVAEPGSTLQWEFFTTDYDIAFELSVKETASPDSAGKKTKKHIIHPPSRAESHLFPQSGQHKCLTAGEYVFKFDNSYSLIRSKEVFLSIKILPPNAETGSELKACSPSNGNPISSSQGKSDDHDHVLTSTSNGNDSVEDLDDELD